MNHGLQTLDLVSNMRVWTRHQLLNQLYKQARKLMDIGIGGSCAGCCLCICYYLLADVV